MDFIKKIANLLKLKTRIFIVLIKRIFSKKFIRNTNISKNYKEKIPKIISIESLISELEEHGVSSNDVLFIHSSYKALGRFVEKPNEIISKLKIWMADRGTLLFPAFTMASSQHNEISSNSEFNLDSLRITTGVLPFFAAKDKDFHRSFHPTHSVVSYGKYSRELLNEHGQDGTATGITSPFYKMIKHEGKIINLGVGLNQTTAVHTIEEVPNIFFPIKTVSKKEFNVSISKESCTKNFQIKPLAPGLHNIRDVDQVKPALHDAGALVEFKFGDGVIQIIDSNLLYITLKNLSINGKTIYGKWF